VVTRLLHQIRRRSGRRLPDRRLLQDGGSGARKTHRTPRRIVSKEPTAGFWATQTDADELGARYDVIDPLLYRLVEEGRSFDEAVAELQIDRDTAEEIASLHADTEHKRATPPTPGIAGRGKEGLHDGSDALE